MLLSLAIGMADALDAAHDLAYEDGNGFLVKLRAAAEYDGLRDHPRFRAVLEKMQL